MTADPEITPTIPAPPSDPALSAAPPQETPLLAPTPAPTIAPAPPTPQARKRLTTSSVVSLAIGQTTGVPVISSGSSVIAVKTSNGLTCLVTTGEEPTLVIQPAAKTERAIRLSQSGLAQTTLFIDRERAKVVAALTKALQSLGGALEHLTKHETPLEEVIDND